MRAYILTIGIIFALITLAHVARFVLENPRLITGPVLMLLTVLTAGLCVWAWRILPKRN
ncbi:MAG: hypothetical protein O2856_16435 [Planctomycetota bacterium]|nr:hypothetical protein [Planctomycetota bacterium]